MKKRSKRAVAVLLMALTVILCGCVTTVEQMYRLPRRSERYENLQTVMDQAMDDLQYSAPASGDNQQTVQMADLDGDGNSEIILFAKGGEKNPMKILLFAPCDDGYEYMTALESPGTGFDQVEYVQMDGKPGLELVVGRQVSDQVLRNVSVYTFSDGTPRQLMNANYVKFLTCDLNRDQLDDLFVIHPGLEEGDRAIAELYSMPEGELERSAEAELSGPAEQLKRIVTGTLESGEPAVYVASTAGEQSIITDIFAVVRKRLTNISFSSDSGTSVNTLRNYYVYADDIDSDGVVELPDLITMETPEEAQGTQQHLIRWYSMRSSGRQVNKMYTYHNYLDGWYIRMPEELAARTLVMKNAAGGYEFYLWDEGRTNRQLVYTVCVFTGDDRLSLADEGAFIQLMKTDNAVYGAKIEPAASGFGITAAELISSFHLVQTDWKTGEM